MAQDNAEALRWYRLAADQGNAIAQNNIDYWYEQGWGVARDYDEAMPWFRKAADRGDINAKHNVAVGERISQ